MEMVLLSICELVNHVNWGYKMNKVAVFCGSRQGINPLYIQVAEELGKVLAANQLELVYGGSSIGLMGAVANAVLQSGGKVLGIIPTFLSDREISHQHVTELKVVHSMHERKALIYDSSDAFIIMPGGIGTLDEFFEIFTWHAIGQHSKPIGILNVHHYYDPLLKLLDHMVEQEFLSKATKDALYAEENPEKLIHALRLRMNS